MVYEHPFGFPWKLVKQHTFAAADLGKTCLRRLTTLSHWCMVYRIVWIKFVIRCCYCCCPDYGKRWKTVGGKSKIRVAPNEAQTSVKLSATPTVMILICFTKDDNPQVIGTMWYVCIWCLNHIYIYVHVYIYCAKQWDMFITYSRDIYIYTCFLQTPVCYLSPSTDQSTFSNAIWGLPGRHGKCLRTHW